MGGKSSTRIEGFQFSMSAVITYNPVLHDRVKHMEVGKHFFTEKIEKEQTCISYVPTAEQS